MRHPASRSRTGGGLESNQWMKRVVDRYEARLVGYTCRFLPLEEAREVVQESLIRAWRSEQDGKSVEIPPWLYAVCRNLAFDRLKKEGRMRTFMDGEAEEVVDTTPLTPELIESLEMDEAIRRCMKSLSAKAQEALRLKFQEELSYKEIAEIMHESQSNVGVLIHEGLKKLRLYLETPLTARKDRK
jgi:RNA polymerase sigma factor (sigma-70 family)